MTTYSTEKLAERNLDIQGLPLPDGTGVGAIGHALARGTETLWKSIRTNGAYSVVRRNPGLFLADAANFHKMINATGGQLNYGALQRFTEALSGRTDGMQLYQVHVSMYSAIKDEMVSLVSDHIADDVLEQTGHDLRTAEGRAALADVEVTGL